MLQNWPQNHKKSLGAGAKPQIPLGNFHPPGLAPPLLNPKYATAYIRYVDCIPVNLNNIINLSGSVNVPFMTIYGIFKQ